MTELVEYQVYLDSMGGATVLTCQPLGINNIEFPYSELSNETIKKTILDYKFLKEEDATFDILVIDNRVAPVNFNEERAKESKDFTKNRNELISKKLKK